MDRDEELRRRRGEHTRSYSQDRPIGSGENASALIRGIKQWLPDIPGSVGDLVDMAYAGGRNVLQGQKQRSIPSLGLGEKARKLVKQRPGLEQVQMTETPETNWLEEGTRMLNPAMFMSPKNIATMGGLALAGGVPGASMAIVKPRGGNWFTGSGSELELGMEWFAQGHNTPMFGAERAKALREWLGGPLMRYIKRDLATENDPVRKLLELDPPVSHVNPEALLERAGYGPLAARAAKARKAAKMPVEGVGTSPLSRAWETIADASIKNKKAGKIKPEDYPAGDPMAQDWVAKLPKNTPIYDDYSAGLIPSDLKLYHLRDELWNAVREDSDLPNALKLKPEDFQQMGIEKAIRHVANINDWRAPQQAAANMEMLSGPGVKLIREYPENNPKGLRWVELSAPREAPDSVLSQLSKQELAQYKEFLDYGDDPLEALRNVLYDEENPLVESLRKQLKYEGDTMGHCVGGYCDDVLEGSTKIFSLRDAKGEPHVTIEAAPGASPELVDLHRQAEEAYGPLRTKKELAAWRNSLSDKDYDRYFDLAELVESGRQFSTAPSIIQIKGKQNRAPKEDYLPFVKDFLANPYHGSTWGENIGDLDTLGLSPEDLAKIPRGYAQGGLVGKQDFNGVVGYILD